MKRYNWKMDYENDYVMQEDPTGEFVLWSDVKPLIDLLKDANSTVRTHAMQTYSRVSSKLADDIDKALKGEAG